MKNKYTFNYPVEIVYKAIGNLVIDNAMMYTKKVYTLDQLEKIDYTYTKKTSSGPLKTHSKVIEAIPNQKIVYTVKCEKLENYKVSFNLDTINDFKTKLHYSYDLISDKATHRINHSIFGYLYRIQQVKKFKSMCLYLDNKCEELVNEG